MSQRPFHLIILGLPGAGKGTQGKLIKERFGLSYLSTGDLIRKLCINTDDKNPFYIKVRDRCNKGIPQPDDIIVEIVKKKLKTIDLKKGIIFDDFPLSMPQVEDLEKIIEDFDLPCPTLLYIDVSEKEVVKRLGKRKFCPKCNVAYYPGSPGYKSGKCSNCGGKITVREDDKPEVVERRLEEYKKRIAPIMKYYNEKDRLIKINGEQSIGKVFAEILDKLEV